MNRAMKDSGLPLTGNIPTHWNTIPIKFCTAINEKVLAETTDTDYAFRYIDIGSVDFYKGITEYQEIKFKEAPSRARRVVRKNDVIVSTVRTYLKAVVDIVDDDDVVVSTGFAVLTPNEEVVPRYLAYACKSNSFCDEVERNSYGISYPAINSTSIGSLAIPFPTLTEQKAIAKFLDDKCGKIDTLISAEEKAITQLADYKKAIISQSVTKGLNPKTRFKDSGVEYFGEIPHDWEVIRNKNLFKIKKEIVGENFTEYELLSLTQRGVIKKDIDNLDGNLPESFATYQQVPKDTIVIALFDISTRSTSISGWARDEGMITSAYRVLIPNEKVNLGYYDYLFTHIGSDRCYVAEGKNIRCSIDEETFYAITIICPPLSIQKEIAEYLDKKTSETDNLITLKQKKIVELKEYKKSLIYQYVTGKKQP